MSAPATKPLALAELTTRPAGRISDSRSKAVAKSRSIAADKTLVEVPGASHVSHAMRSASTSKRQLPICVMAYAASSACSWIVKSQISGK